MMSAAYDLGQVLAKQAATLTADAGSRFMGGKQDPGMAVHATSRVRSAIIPDKEKKHKPFKPVKAKAPKSPGPPNIPAAGTTGWGPR